MWYWSICYQLNTFGFQLGFLKLARADFSMKHLHGVSAKMWICQLLAAEDSGQRKFLVVRLLVRINYISLIIRHN